LAPGTGSTVKILNFLKIKDGSGRHLEKSQKSRYLHNGLTDLYEIIVKTSQFKTSCKDDCG